MDQTENSEFCGFHQYMKDYTKEQLDAIELCLGCKMYKFIEDDYESCTVCRERGAKNREIHRTTKQVCKFCQTYEANESGYCGKHIYYAFYETYEPNLEYFKRKLRIDEEYRLSKISAEDRKKSFELTIEEYASFLPKLCHYCNEMDLRSWNGIDRVVNDTGYKISNCVSCCSICNHLKYNSIDDKKFMTICKKYI